MSEAEKLARKLSDAQREMLTGFVSWRHGNCILCQGNWRTGEALERRGITRSIRALTDLGQEVRRILQTEPQP